MNIQKILIGGIVGGIVAFLLGWAIFGIVLHDMMEAGKTKFSGAGVWKVDTETEMQTIIWAIAAAQFAWSFLLAWLFSKMGTTGAMSGFINGFLIFLLMAAGFDLMMYAFSNLYVPSFYIKDILLSGAMGGVVGAVIAWVMGMGSKKAAA